MKHRVIFTVLIASILIMAATVHAQSVVVTEGIVNAPVAEVWRSFTTKEGIESWMVAKTDIELRLGGLWRTSYSKQSNLDDDAAIHHVVLGYDPERLLVFRTIKPPKNFPFPKALMNTWNVVYFEPAGDTRTKVTTHMLGFTDDPESQGMRAFFETGNKQTMDSLIKKFLK
jgi:uncharacterized protein YndB with AHSA1/START domain